MSDTENQLRAALAWAMKRVSDLEVHLNSRSIKWFCLYCRAKGGPRDSIKHKKSCPYAAAMRLVERNEDGT
jgi:hypothetical protein